MTFSSATCTSSVEKTSRFIFMHQVHQLAPKSAKTILFVALASASAFSSPPENQGTLLCAGLVGAGPGPGAGAGWGGCCGAGCDCGFAAGACAGDRVGAGAGAGCAAVPASG